MLTDEAGNALDTSAAIADNTILIVLTAYETWTGEGGSTFDNDTNQDGIADGIAWVLGASDPGADAHSKLPIASTGSGEDAGELTLQFSMLNAASRGSAVVILEYSNDLGVADDWSSHRITIPETSSTVGGVVFVITPNGNSNQVQATIPATGAGNGKLFSRISLEP